MKKSLYKWEKHDVVNYLLSNFLEKEVEFTTETLIKKIENSKHDYWFGYGDKVISNHLFNLSVEGYLKVRYISVKMSEGSKTVAIYRLKNRSEKN